jgi:hypothetical protein
MPELTLSPLGFPILIGLNALDNHMLSTHIVKSCDLWFHAHDSQGPHIVLRLQNRDPGVNIDSDIMYCKILAINRSKDGKCVTMSKGSEVNYLDKFPYSSVKLSGIFRKSMNRSSNASSM